LDRGIRVALFLSTFINKVDKKGRVSVPANFRNNLVDQSLNAIVAFRSLKLPALECSGLDRMEELTTRLDALPEFSDEREALSFFLSESHIIPFDSEGRIILPEPLVQHAGIGENATFAGVGRTFQIWEPQRFSQHQEEMRERARQRGMTLPPIIAQQRDGPR
jgi:MraZ protein